MNTMVSSATAKGTFITQPSKEDPYIYQVGFGNRFASEAIPGTLPQGQNSPQKGKYGLYTEGISGTAFVAPRHENELAWLYRIQPSVAHGGFKALPPNPDLESNFLPVNPKVHVSPSLLSWRPLDIPSPKTDFIDSLKTVAGSGDPTISDGLAVHIYAANASMGKKAFVNTDGDMLIVPSQGRLDIQTEFGKLMVRHGEIVVIQSGIKFKVSLPDGPSRGYIQEVFGVHYELPELGVLGANGLANPRDFESPVASFDLDQSPWEVIYKVAGTLHVCNVNSTPFDVVAWHGNYVPYKYALEKFIGVGSISKDHADPSVFTVLTVKSKKPGTPLVDFAIFSPRWDIATDTFRLPYYHRNAATELMGVIYGTYGARDDGFVPGAVRCTNKFSPHGVSAQEYKEASEMELKPCRINEGSIAFMFESSMMLTITDYAMKWSGRPHEDDPEAYDNLKPEFVSNLDKVNADLCALGLDELRTA